MNSKFLVIFTFIIISFFITKYENISINKKKDIYREMGNYSLYNYFKYPQISILIPNIEYLNFNDNKLLNFITIFLNQTIKDIEILFSMNQKDKTHIIKNISLIDKRIKIYYIKNRNILYNLLYLINKSKGKFSIVIFKYITLEIDELKQFYNYTKGKINNIFTFITKNLDLLYLIKSSTLKNIIDNDIYFTSFKNIKNYIKSMGKPNLHYISIALCPDNYYSKLAYVAMISILNSKSYYTYISFYMIISNTFTKENILLLESLYDQYDYFNITYIKIDDRYNNAFISRYINKQAYYRFSLGELIPYLKRIIYIDTDIIVFKDLSKLFNINFEGKIILGQITIFNKSRKTGRYNINSGVMLLNLEAMRKIKMEKKVLSIINKGFKSNFHDQGLINRYLYKYVGLFPPEYHTRPITNYKEIIEFNNKSGNLFDKDYFYFSWKYPTIRHYVGYSKPIFSNANNSIEDWWYFARKSKFYKRKTYNLTNAFKKILY